MSILLKSTLAGQPAGGPTVQELIDAYLAVGTDEMSQHHREEVHRSMRRFVAGFGPRRVSELRAIDLQVWLKKLPTFKSGWSFANLVARIKRLFNWAVEVDLIERNPFARVRAGGRRRRRRPMSDQELQALLRGADPGFRRFLLFLKFSGARPIELSTMRWRHVRFDQSSVVLEEHKTAHRTGRPRLIPLVPPLVKMLVWMRSHRQASVIGLVERAIRANGGRIRAGELFRRMRPFGMSVHAIQRARLALNLQREYVEDHWEYVLPDDYLELPDPGDHDFVFINCRGNAFNRRSLCRKVERIRRRVGLPKHVTLYGLRHRFGLTGIKNKVNLKLLSLAMGHTDVRTTQNYIDEAGLTPEVHEAALQVAFGPNAIPGALQALKPRVITMLTAPPAEKIATIAEHLPAPHGSRPRPQVATDPPRLTNGRSAPLEELLREVLGRLSSSPPRRQPASLVPRVLNPAPTACYRALQWAIKTEPALAGGTDRQVFEWLEGRADCPHKTPPSVETFFRYVSMARLFYDCRKRVFRNRQPEPTPPAEE
jgi:integrase